MVSKPLTVIFIILILFSTALFAELKIGYVNSNQIYLNCIEAIKAKKKMEKFIKKIENEAAALKKEIETLKSQISQKSLLLSMEGKAALKNQLQLKVSEFQSFMAENYGEKGVIVRKNSEIMKPILARIEKIIIRIAKQDDLDFVFDIEMAGLFYAKKKYNITERVIGMLNKGKG